MREVEKFSELSKKSYLCNTTKFRTSRWKIGLISERERGCCGTEEFYFNEWDLSVEGFAGRINFLKISKFETKTFEFGIVTDVWF